MYQRILALLVSGALLIIAFGAIRPEPQAAPKRVAYRITMADLAVSPKLNQAELACLKRNIYFEAGDQSVKGMEAVALVTVNRTRTKVYPQTICGVVKQSAIVKRTGRRVCQFSWMCDGKADEPSLTITVKDKHGKLRVVPNTLELEAWQQADTVARNIMEGKVENFLGKATHYHGTYVNPGWASAKRMHRIARVGSHIFYRDVKLSLRDA